ncbi:MAG: permease [Planctomycetota bacterium]
MNLFFASLWALSCELAPWLLLGALVAGVIHALLPAGVLERQLRGRVGVVKAVAIGVPLPLCSCGVVPVGLSLKKQGAGVGAAVGFLIATPQTGIDSLLVTGPLLGWPFALFKVVVALVTGVVGGALAEALSKPAPPSLDVLQPAPVANRDVWWREALRHADDVFASIWRWLLVGLVIAAALAAWLPPAALTGLAAQGAMAAIVATLLASLPLYVCATASAPIAATLAGNGLPMAAVLVFLMAGPATNAATIAALWRGIGGRATLVYLATIIVGSVAGGLLYEAIADPFAWRAPSGHEHHGHGSIPLWRVGCVVVFGAWMVRFAWRDIARWLPSRVATSVQTVGVDGMRCGACVAKLETALLADPDIDAALVRLEPGTAEVSGAVAAARVTQIVEQTGFVVRP